MLAALRFAKASSSRNNAASRLRVLCGHRHIAMNLPRGLTTEHEARAFWKMQGHGLKEVSEFLSPLHQGLFHQKCLVIPLPAVLSGRTIFLR